MAVLFVLAVAILGYCVGALAHAFQKAWDVFKTNQFTGTYEQKFVHHLGKSRGQHLSLEYQDADRTTCSLVYCVPAKTDAFPMPDASLSVEGRLKELQSRVEALHA